MLSVIRRLLVLLLVVSLPVQGWAASRMALAMTIGHGHGSDQGMVHVHHGAADEAGTPPAATLADCCVGHDGGHFGTHGPDSGHTPCGESCHCCVSMALSTLMLQLTVQNTPADWYRVADCAFTQVSAPTPDKPPKG